MTMLTVVATVCFMAAPQACEEAVVRVIDGDTVAIHAASNGGQEERIRFAGIDAPEMDGGCAREAELARAATDRVAQLVDRAEQVKVERTGADRYGRTLARISVNGSDLGEILMSEGLAREWEEVWRPELAGYWCR